MAFDYKKEYKEYYMPKNRPEIVTVPQMNFIAVRGTGDPNEEGGDYKAAIGLLYGIAFTIKMSKKGDHRIEGYFDYVVPPLEGFWRQEGIDGIDYARKADFHWISVIRLPDFVTREDFEWAVEEAQKKKKQDFSKVEFLTLEEGLCVQCMHVGPFDAEPETIAKMDRYLQENGYENDFSEGRLHHEIYLSDARRTAPEKWRTVVRHPVKKKQLVGNG
ncbi:MAG: GyrI-like domain-containing protein [Lachnospiraceae bacterium]